MNSKRFIVLISLVVFFASCGKRTPPADLARETIFPKPVSVTAAPDPFTLGKDTKMLLRGSGELEPIARYFMDKVREESGIALTMSTGTEKDETGTILLQVAGNDQELGDEGYALTIGKNGISITANKPAGVFYGVQTLRQLIPLKGKITGNEVDIAGGTIRDYPQYAFRGYMLDIARHFFGVDDIKRNIDQISFYKMNVLHLHLADDQGWRIEIKSWPNLTAVGGTTQVDGGKGGFLTQDDYKELVRYAAEHYITVIPEIDMPGHTNAALASVPELNCDGKATKLYTGIEVGFSSFCTKKEFTYKFIDDVVRELAEMTPGPYLHVGGDESHATKKEDYIPFVSRVQEIVAAHNKTMIGWEETAQSKLNPSTLVQHWANATYPSMAVAQGGKVIMSPAKRTYLDMKYDSTTKLGQKWAAYIEIDSAYLWDPATRVKGISRENIVGVEAPLWTEKITTMDEIEYMIFPRIIGVAEIAWTPSSARSWDDYKARLGTHGPRLKAMGIDFYPSKQITWSE